MTQQLDFHSHQVLSRIGNDNQWVKLKHSVNWEAFRPVLRKLDRSSGPQGGRPPYDPVAMLRVVLLGQWHDLSDADLEQVLYVRLDFMCFAGFNLSGYVPDSTTIQDFRSRLIEHKLLESCFKLLNQQLETAGLKVKAAKLVLDSTVIEAAARPRNVITPGDDQNPPTKSCSADPDARWTKKGKQYHFGFKEHALVDGEDGYIEDVLVTPANVHDGTMLEQTLKGKRGVKELLADKAYASKKNRNYLKKRGIIDSILRKGRRGHPLAEDDIQHNKRISSRRFVAEQQFGTKKLRFRFFRTRYFTTVRVQAQAFLKAICCNLLKAVRQLAPPLPAAA